MPRMTRAKAAEVAEQLHIDEDAVLDLRRRNRVSIGDVEPKPSAARRAPLGEIAANSLVAELEDSSHAHITPVKGMASTRAVKGGARGSKDNAGTPTAANATKAIDALNAASRECEITPSRASEETAKYLMNRTSELSHSPARHDMSSSAAAATASTHALTAESTRSPQGSTLPFSCEATEPKSLATVKVSNCGEGTVTEPANIATGDGPSHSEATGTMTTTVSQDSIKTSANRPENMPSTMQRTRSRSPVRLTTPKSQISSSSMHSGNDVTYDELEAAAVHAQTPPRATRDSLTECNLENPAEVEEVAEKVTTPAAVAQTLPAKSNKSQKPAPIVRTTKASQARISLAHGPKDAGRVPSLGRPRQSIAPNDADGKRVTSTSSASSSASAESTSKKEVVIPHSKPRPMSMSFPAPLPLAKSSKAPTQSTFQLPGEAVAAKLKAAKEARLAREADDQKKKPFKARPVPATSSRTPAVRHTSSSMRRESLISARAPETSDATAHRRASSVATSGPRASLSKTAPSRPSSTVPPSNRISQGPSTAMENLSKVRASEDSCSTTSSVRPPSAAQASRSGPGTAKGKEVFNRAAQAKAAAEKDKGEKEEAAKKARAEAAERSRKQSREWAEKQRLRKLSKQESSSTEPMDAVTA